MLWWGLNHFIFLNAHFLSVNIFQGEGGCEVCMNCFTVRGVGINPRQADRVSHV